MDGRELRGLEIAESGRVTKRGDIWLVPSQSGSGRYSVCFEAGNYYCNCRDHETHAGKCKHIWAVEHLARCTVAPGPHEAAPRSISKRTYPQDWRAYNTAQTREKERFLDLLRDLCAGVIESERPKNGRPRLPIQDAIFSACFKVYSTVSGRRFMSDLRDAQAKGFISKLPHFNSIFNYLENPELTPILRDMITETSLPLKAVEVDFAANSSGFTTSRFIRWFDHKYGTVRQQHEWVKVHLMCGVRTNIVTAVEIRGRLCT